MRFFIFIEQHLLEHVDHEILISKFAYINARRNVVTWFVAFQGLYVVLVIFNFKVCSYGLHEEVRNLDGFFVDDMNIDEVR